VSDAAVARAREIVRDLFSAALEAVDPERALRGSLSRAIGSVWVAGTNVPAPRGIHVINVGKAAVAMTLGALEILDGDIVSGDVITKVGHVGAALPKRIRVHEASHPIPDERGVAATRVALDALHALSPETVVLALISGGGSALLEAPRNGLTLADLAVTTSLLLRAGAPIDALNAVRAPLSRVKGGGLREAAPASQWVTLILSDVLGNDPRIIASGPTVPGHNDPRLALEIIDRYGIRLVIPPAILAALEHAEAQSASPLREDDIVHIIGDNATAVSAARERARALGLAPMVNWEEAAELGRAFVAATEKAPADIDVLLGGGEATVTVRGAGCGGRNTEFALAAALEMERRGNSGWVIASLATDGQDALTGLAGAIADPGTAGRARALNLDPEGALHENDSAAIFTTAGGAVETGPTGTNVNDLYLAVRLRPSASDCAGKGT
jgi:glycerate 2-kinase